MHDTELDKAPARQFADKHSALCAVDDLAAQLKVLPAIQPQTVVLLTEDLKLKTTFDSNAIEGSKLTLNDTVDVVKNGRIGRNARVRDVFAAQGFAYGYEAMYEFANENRPVDESLILHFHRYVMLGARPEYCGVWRDHEVRIAGADFHTAHHSQVPQKCT